MPRYAEVVVNRPILQRRRVTTNGESHTEWRTADDTRQKTFHYHLPPELSDRARIGQLVAVPFRTQMLQAVIIGLGDTSPIAETRPVAAILDDRPALNESQLALAQWLAAEYLAPLPTVLRHFLPPGANRQPLTVVEPLTTDPAPAGLSPTEMALLRYLQMQKKPVPLEDLDARTVKSLAEKNLVQRRATLSKPRVGPRIERTVELLISPDEFEDALFRVGRNSKQADILRFLWQTDDPLPRESVALAAAGAASDSPLGGLEKRGWIERLPAQTLVLPAPNFSGTENLSAAEKTLLATLQSAGQPVDEASLPPDSKSALKSLREQQAVVLLKEPPRVALRLPPADVPAAIIALRGAEKHARVLELLAQEEGSVWLGWIFAQTDATQKTLSDLAAIGAVALDEARRWRDPLAGKAFTLAQPPILTTEQRDVLAKIVPALDHFGKPFLIHGVTGAGKTEIYLQAIARVLRRGKGVIFLVPEIMLATQIIERVRARFPDRVAVWHSALSPGERFDTWERVRDGKLSIVVGARSALFAPIQQLGLIIVDEEHEPAYKQDRAPTFHAREAAIELARLNDAPVILGSATPDVVSFRKAERGEYRLLSLPNRILAHAEHLAVQAALLKKKRANITVPRGKSVVTLPLPPVEVVDLREELKAGNRSIFSRALSTAIAETLNRDEQIILFLNRRGTATFVMCRDCGYVANCPRCDSTLTFHQPSGQLVCHHCGYRGESPSVCPECGSERIRYFGLGTERVEAALKRQFPQARPIRLDRDTTRKPGSHYTFLQHFIAGRANVMIGTQMVAKGLDLPLVTLVGVISADTGLYLPDFRAAERTFQVLMQVAGRAGRSPLGGKVIVQTYTPDQHAIIAAAAHDYHTFYRDELAFRYEQGYPPFKRLARLTFAGYGREQSQAEAETLANELRLWVDREGFPAVEIIGPAPTYVQRVGNRFRWQILVRAPNPAEILRPVPLPLNWRVDIDPVSLL